MTRRTKEQWLSLFELHEQSGLSAAAFCRQHALNPKYFGLRRKQLQTAESSHNSVPFVRVASSNPLDARPTLMLRGGFGELSLPGSVSPEWLASLLKHLS